MEGEKLELGEIEKMSEKNIQLYVPVRNYNKYRNIDLNVMEYESNVDLLRKLSDINVEGRRL